MTLSGLEGCDIRKPMLYLDSGCSRHMTSVKSYLHKYVEQPKPKVVFRDDSTCTTEGYGSIKCNGIVFTKVAFVNGLKYNLVSISQQCDVKYIVQFDEKRATIFNSNKEIVMISPRVRDVYVLDMTSSAQESCFFEKAIKNLNWLWYKRLAHLNFKTINQLEKQNLVIGLPLSTQRINHVHHVKRESIIELTSKQNKHPLSTVITQNDEILNDDQSEHSNHNNDNHIINNLLNTKYVQTSEPLSSPADDASVLNTNPILTNPSLSIPSMASPTPQDKWSQDKHIKPVNIIGNPGAGMLNRAMAKELSAASTHECLFVDFLSEEEPKKVSKALKHPRCVDSMQEELNQFAKNKVWILVLAPYGKTIIGS
ncbi:retrovirus-related pol polyprotein from transposon TNT 1-94 [Tanacetum coccineum]